MKYFLAPFAVLAVCIALRVISLSVQLSKSGYGESSGNSVWNLLFNKGNYGEFLTYRILEKNGENRILCNVYLPKSNEETTEIDLISVNRKGIFVYESKNYSGWIFGDEKSRTWTQSLKGGTKNKFFNPIFQNKGHISAINKYLDGEYKDCFVSYIVFSERCELKKVSVNSEKTRVINRQRLSASLNDDKNNLPDVLTDEEAEAIYSKLKTKTLVSDSVKEEHIKAIKNRK